MDIQSILVHLPKITQDILVTKPIKYQELLLTTFSKQSEDRKQLLISIFEQHDFEVQNELFKKDIRLLKAMIKLDTDTLLDMYKRPEYVISLVK
jgi:hypothetical protein